MSEMPPVATEAEKAILGAVFLEPDLFAVIKSRVNLDMFYDFRNAIVFGAMNKISDRGQSIQMPLVWDQLEAERRTHDVSLVYLTELQNNIVTTSVLDSYIERLKAAYGARAIRRAAELIDKAVEGWGGDIDALSSATRAIVADALSKIGDHDNKTVRVDELVKEFYDSWENKDAEKSLVKTGFPNLDKMTGGLRRGWVTVVAGRPGMGKSAFLRNVTTNAALSGKSVLCVELEDTNQQALKRILSRLAGVPLEDLDEGRIKTEYISPVIGAITRLGNKPLWFNDTPGLTSQQICNLAFVQKQKHGLDLLCVDHLLEIGDRGEVYDRISAGMVALRNLAKEMDIPVLLATQINRKVEDRQTKKPVLSDLKQTGKIEEAARAVWLLYRPGYYEDEPDDPRMEVIVAKSTQGRTGSAYMHAVLKHMAVSSWDSSIHGQYRKTDAAMKPVTPDNSDIKWEGY